MKPLDEALREAVNTAWDASAKFTRQQMADEITRLRARVAELEAALRPFADDADTYDDGITRDDAIPNIISDVTVGHLREARRLLPPAPPAQGGDG